MSLWALTGSPRARYLDACSSFGGRPDEWQRAGMPWRMVCPPDTIQRAGCTDPAGAHGRVARRGARRETDPSLPKGTITVRVRRFITSGLLAAGISAVGIAVLAGP